MSRMHARAVIVSIGDELVLGQTLDTNSAWLSGELVARGVRVVRHVTVDDEVGVIAAEIERGAGDAELVVVTGGLGPTADDLTRAGLAGAMGVELEVDAGAMADLEAWYSDRGRPMPELNRVQAMKPTGAACLENPHGTAPGLRGVVGGADVFCLPGPPREMRPMFEGFVVPALVVGRAVETRMVRTFGMGESRVAELLGELMDRGRNPVVGTTAKAGVVSVRMRWEGKVGGEGGARSAPPREEWKEGRRTGLKPVPREGEEALGETERVVRERLGVAVVTPVGVDGGEDLAGIVVGLLASRGERLAVVESCTGGLLGSMVTGVEGSSEVFCGGWLTYTNAMKVGEVGVPEGFFPEVREGAPGAVSGEVARAMAVGGLERGRWGLEAGGGEGREKEGAWKGPAPEASKEKEGAWEGPAPEASKEQEGAWEGPAPVGGGVDHALAITGIAGPGGGSEEKPVGTVWVCWAGGDGAVDCRRYVFPGGRGAVREWAAVTALGLLRMKLAGVDMELVFERERVVVAGGR